MNTLNFSRTKCRLSVTLAAVMILSVFLLPARAAQTDPDYLLREEHHSPMGNTALNYHYDTQGNLVYMQSDDHAIGTAYEYDAEGNLTAEHSLARDWQDSWGSRMDGWFFKEYQPDGTLSTETHIQGTGPELELLICTYDEKGSPQEQWQGRLSAGAIPAAVVETSRVICENTYDSQGRPISRLHRTLDQQGIPQLAEAYLWTYEKGGGYTLDHTVCSPLYGDVTHHTVTRYDGEGRPLSSFRDKDNTAPADQRTEFTYDHRGNLTREVLTIRESDRQSYVKTTESRNTYDAQGRMTAKHTTETEQTLVRGKVTQATASQPIAETYAYDAQGHLIRHTVNEEETIYFYGPLPQLP